MLDERRMCLLCYFFLACSIVLVGRLFWLQCLNGEAFMEVAIRQRSMTIRMEPDRGIIVDRNGEPLAGGFPTDVVAVFPALVREPGRVAHLVAQASGLPEQDIARQIASGTPFSIPAALPRGQSADMEALGLESQGVILLRGRARYAAGNMAAHLIGYLASRDGHGAGGIEASFDRYLSGGSGTRLAAFINAHGGLIPGLGYRVIPGDAGPGAKPGPDVRAELGARAAPGAKAGSNGKAEPDGRARPNDGDDVRLVLTIDRRIQAVVEDVADRYLERGAVVVMDPCTGDILAMASRPTFDPNNPAQFLGDSRAPLVNRAINAYPPGSVLKVLVAAAALQEGIVTPDEVFVDPGYIDVGSVRFRCYKAEEGGHGRLTFSEALSVSCNPVFIDVGQRLGRRKLVEYLETCGFGGPTGSGLPEEKPGSIPDTWRMSLQDLANASIGQGMVAATPLQVARLIAAIANGGVLPNPRIVMEVRDTGRSAMDVGRGATNAGRGTEDMGRRTVNIGRGAVDAGCGTANVGRGPGDASRGTIKRVGTVPGKRVFEPAIAAKLREMLRGVVMNGTGRQAEVPHFGAAGKTGTSETGRFTPDGKPITHGWFAGYAPYDEPRLVIVVFAEEGGAGGDVAARAFKEIAERTCTFLAPVHIVNNEF